MAEQKLQRKQHEANGQIEVGLSQLKETLNQLEYTAIMSPTKEQKRNCNYEKPKKNRELEDLDEGQIIQARLRSDSGRVYSESVIVGTNVEKDPLEPLEEYSEDEMPGNCVEGACCKNTAKIVTMINKLQQSVDEIKTSTQRQVIVNSNTNSDIEKIKQRSKNNASEINDLKKELNECNFQLKLVANVVIRQDEQINTLHRKLAEAQQREMSANLVITGIPEKQNENPIQEYNKFIQDQLEIQELIPIHRAYRIGAGANRPLVVELRDPLTQKGKIYKSVKKLRQKRNPQGNRYFVADHLPEEMNENRRRINDIIAENKKKEPSEQHNLEVKRGRLLIDGKQYTKEVNAPKPADIFYPDEKQMDLADEIDMVKGKDEESGNSTFVAYAAAVESLQDISAAYIKVRTKFAQASHVVCAYRLQGKDTYNRQDYVDDGEIGAGRTILNVLKEEKLMNVVVFMIRRYGGRHLGSARFDYFKKVTFSAIEALRLRIEDLKKNQKEEEERERLRQEQQKHAFPQEWHQTPTEDWSTQAKDKEES